MLTCFILPLPTESLNVSFVKKYSIIVTGVVECEYEYELLLVSVLMGVLMVLLNSRYGMMQVILTFLVCLAAQQHKSVYTNTTSFGNQFISP